MVDPKAFLQIPFTGSIDARDLALFRFLFCVSLCYAHAALFSYHLSLYASGYVEPLVSGAFLPSAVQMGVVYVLGIGLIVTLVSSALGIYTRISLALSSLFFLLFQKPIIDVFGWHDAQLPFFVLVTLVVAPGISHITMFTFRKLRSQRAYVPAWPFDTVILLLALAYLMAGLNKLLIGGLRWADGSTIQVLFLEFYTLKEYVLSFILLQHGWLLVLAATAVLIFQTTFWLILFVPALRLAYICGGLALHALIYLTTGINFFPYFVIAYLVFVRWSWLQRISKLLKCHIRLSS